MLDALIIRLQVFGTATVTTPERRIPHPLRVRMILFLMGQQRWFDGKRWVAKPKIEPHRRMFIRRVGEAGWTGLSDHGADILCGNRRMSLKSS